MEAPVVALALLAQTVLSSCSPLTNVEVAGSVPLQLFHSLQLWMA